MAPPGPSTSNFSIDASIVLCLGDSLDAKPFDDFAFHKMAVDDLVNVVCIDVGVPDAVGVDDDARTLLAAIQAAGLVDSNLSFAVQIKLFDAGFGMLLHRRRVMVGATCRTVVALVQAKENVTLVVTHAQL